MSTARLIGAFVSIMLVSAMACSSSDEAPTTTSTDAGVEGGTSAEGGDGEVKCKSTATTSACEACCGDVKDTKAFKNATEDCICEDACATECGSTCPNNPSAECEDCRGSDSTTDTCRDKATSACENDPECAEAQACALAAGCADKPN